MALGKTKLPLYEQIEAVLALNVFVVHFPFMSFKICLMETGMTKVVSRYQGKYLFHRARSTHTGL